VESIFGWLGQIFDAILSFIPRLVIVRATNNAVKWRHGKKAIPVKPGLVWYWPLVTELDHQVVARQTLNLPNQNLTTADDIPVALSGFVVYTIHDVVLAVGEKNYDVDDTLSDLAQAAIVEEVLSLTYEELREGAAGGRDSEVNESLTQNLAEQLLEFGVRVERAGLMNFTKARVYRIISGE